MQFVGTVAEADSHEVRASTRSKTNSYWPAASLRAIPILIVRSVAVLIALASIAAVSLVAVLSIGSYAVGGWPTLPHTEVNAYLLRVPHSSVFEGCGF
ncbi:MAG TPA: hypothetical protein VHN10_05370 [Candidatus Acidoferrales bacterium]|jgi:hypothetical protein|nr:hypothetical protein [Candidatus Acidoferrales bacterium]